jgi:zinc/manganese transport system permease protein
MLEMLSIPFLRQAIFASLLMAVGLSYLGIHVVRRRIVFVDLAIAQLSAVGVALAMLLGRDPTVVSLAVTLVGAGLLSLPAQEKRVPQEAIMGIVYAVASAVSVLIIAKMPHGEADLINLFFGNILAVTTSQIGILALIFGLVGTLHLVFSKQLALRYSSELPCRSFREVGWNLFFYLTLALVIAFAIRTAGVLLVFSNLVIPAVAAFLFTERFRVTIPLAMGFSLLANWAGFYASFRFDLPTGPAIVAALGGGLILAGILKGLLALCTGNPEKKVL